MLLTKDYNSLSDHVRVNFARNWKPEWNRRNKTYRRNRRPQNRAGWSILYWCRAQWRRFRQPYRWWLRVLSPHIFLEDPPWKPASLNPFPNSSPTNPNSKSKTPSGLTTRKFQFQNPSLITTWTSQTQSLSLGTYELNAPLRLKRRWLGRFSRRVLIGPQP